MQLSETTDKYELLPQMPQKWQGRSEWFFNRELTDHYEQWYEGPYKQLEVLEKRVMAQLIGADKRVRTLLEYGCGTTRFTRWWKEIGLEASGGDISPFMLSQALQRFEGDLVLADSHHMPFQNHTFDALAFVTTFEYYRDPIQVIQEAARVGKYGIMFGMMNRYTPKLLRRKLQQAVGKNPFYETAHFYTPSSLQKKIAQALPGRRYSIRWHCTGLPSWFPVQQWQVPYGDFFALYVQFEDVQ